MARWVCFSCGAEMKVRDDLVGQVRKCRGCGVESQIVDADAVVPPPLSPPEKSRKQPTASRLAVTRTTASMAFLGLFGLFAFVGAQASPDRLERATWGAAAGQITVLIILIAPIYGACDDIRKSRLRLDEIAEQLQKKP